VAVKVAEQLPPDLLIRAVRGLLELVPERLAVRAARDEAINAVLVEDVHSVLAEGGAGLLDHAVEGIEKQGQDLIRLGLAGLPTRVR